MVGLSRAATVPGVPDLVERSLLKRLHNGG
jgi:hypothetical protein